MTETMTYLVELAVGVGCLVVAAPSLRSRRLRWLGVALLLAGAAAVFHATVRLLA